jgi:hypothetical protein
MVGHCLGLVEEFRQWSELASAVPVVVIVQKSLAVGTCAIPAKGISACLPATWVLHLNIQILRLVILVVFVLSSQVVRSSKRPEVSVVLAQSALAAGLQILHLLYPNQARRLAIAVCHQP